jgi:ABC-2 type transport system permease protein
MSGRFRGAWALARLEFCELWRSGFLRASALAAMLLAAVALAAGGVRAARLRDEQALAARAVRQQWLEQAPKSPHAAAHFGLWAFRPTPTLAALDEGVDGVLGRAVWLEAHKQNDFVHAEARDEALPPPLVRPSAAALLGVIASLFALVLGHATFARDREGGTRPLLLSLGAGPAAVALGKAAGAFLALLALWAPLAAACALSVALAGHLDAPRLGALLAVWFALHASLLLVSLALSALAPTARAAFAMALLAWLGGVVLAPRALASAAEWASPVPHREGFVRAVAKALEGGPGGDAPAGERVEATKRELLAKHGVARVEDLPFNYDGWALQAGEEESNPVFDRHFGALEGALAGQARFAERFGPVVPSAAARSLSMALAGTDEAHHFAFARAAESWRRSMVKTMNDAMTYGWKAGDWEGESGPETWAKVPDFAWSPPPLGAVLRGQTSNLASLGGFFLLSLASFALAARRWVRAGGDR